MLENDPSGWTAVATPTSEQPPAPLTVRVQTLTARSFFPEHSHDWAQVVYAVSGVLTIMTEGRSFVISPEQAVWLPPGFSHRVGTLFGAEFRSLWIEAGAVCGLVDDATVFAVSPLMKSLIVEAADIHQGLDDDAYRGRVTTLILDQLRRIAPLPGALPWPVSDRLITLCHSLYADPAHDRSESDWSREIGMSERTLRRRFQAEVGMSLRSWRRRMRLFKAIELLGGGLDVTRTALELGYGSASAFIYAFRTEMGVSPNTYMRQHSVSR
ncbi:AraC family transcriptional regulator [Asticcacaulis sp. W401b]|uniref:AraC family transcriptional regulator n=1 Tax=Asticcacaulis sp. W401b TaxID=3388666 RepID=UPI003970E144